MARLVVLYLMNLPSSQLLVLHTYAGLLMRNGTVLYMYCMQNRRQKVFTRGSLYLWGGLYVSVGGLYIENFIKSPLIYSVSYFDLGGLGTLFGG